MDWLSSAEKPIQASGVLVHVFSLAETLCDVFLDSGCLERVQDKRRANRGSIFAVETERDEALLNHFNGFLWKRNGERFSFRHCKGNGIAMHIHCSIFRREKRFGSFWSARLNKKGRPSSRMTAPVGKKF